MNDNMTGLFFDAFSTGSSTSRGFCACGKEHFDFENSWDWEEGELEELQERGEKKDDGVMGHDHSVSYVNIMGNEIVFGCDCEIAQKYEAFINRHMTSIVKYIREIAKQKEGYLEAIKV